MPASNVKTETALFAGGCFWCLFAPFEHEGGVLDVVAGYSGGESENPTYEEVSTGQSGHREVIQITYDPAKISYEKLLEIFWRQIDPTDEGGQFADRGHQYTTAVYYNSEEQRQAAERSKRELLESRKFPKVVTEVLPARPFYPAEEYHQDYNTKNPLRYKAYQEGSGRAPFLRKTWKQD